MDNEKLNRSELNTPEDSEAAKEGSPVTATDLFARLRMNLKDSESLDDAEEKTEEENSGESAEPKGGEQISFSFEENDEKDEKLSLEEAAELMVTEKSPRSNSVTDSVKKLIAEINLAESADESSLAEILKIESEDNGDAEPDLPEEGVTGESAEESEEKDIKPDREYSVLIEKTSDKTNVFDPKDLKKQKRFGDKEKLFDESEQQGVAEAEQLTFSMTEEDIRQSIKEAEAFIYEREHVESPEDVINDTETAAAEETTEDVGENKQGEYDQTDLWIASAFGDEDELKKMYGEEEAQRIETQLDIDVQEYLKDEKKNVRVTKLAEEYTSSSDKKEIFAAYRKAHNVSWIKLVASFAVLIVSFIYENLSTFGGSLPGALNQQNYPVVYILISLQLLVIACAIAWKELYRGLKAVLVMHPIPESISAVVAGASALYHVAHCFISETDPKVALYVFPAVFCIFATLVYDFLSLKREIYSFNIASSKRIKYTINPIDTEKAELENNAFGEYISDVQEVAMFKFGKTDFVSGFYKRMNAYPKSNSSVTLLLSVSIALGLVFFIVATVVQDVKTAFSVGYLAFILSLPFSSLLAFALPFYRASKKAFDDGSAIIGEASLEEYSKATTLSFEDKDVFPSYGVKLKSIKVYGEYAIDKVLYTAGSIFKALGGPLDDVFSTATRDIGSSENMEIIEIAKDGAEGVIDGVHTYIGKASYIKSKGFSPIVESDDDTFEANGEASIMYMITNDTVSAKIYVQYHIDPDFEHSLKRLYKAGICIGIKTFDPNIDDRLLGSKVNISKYPVRILRCNSLDEDKTVTREEADSGVISKSGPRSLLNAFVLCSKVLLVNRRNGWFKILSVIASVLLMAALLVFGKVVSIPSVYVVLYQLFWMVPVFVFSKV